ncbi:hypothetical protein JCM10207_001869 [Rhodosporidiobolus poonsookiae]
MLTSAAASTPAPDPVKPSLALNLPDELWGEILLYSDYGELKTLERVCKKLQKLTKDVKLDSILFRVKPTKKKLHQKQKINLHPLLHAVSPLELTTKEANIWIWGENGAPDVEINAYDLNAADEFVTQPPCTEMYVDFWVGKRIGVSDRNGSSDARAEGLPWHGQVEEDRYWKEWMWPKVLQGGAVELAVNGYDS